MRQLTKSKLDCNANPFVIRVGTTAAVFIAHHGSVDGSVAHHRCARGFLISRCRAPNAENGACIGARIYSDLVDPSALALGKYGGKPVAFRVFLARFGSV